VSWGRLADAGIRRLADLCRTARRLRGKALAVAAAAAAVLLLPLFLGLIIQNRKPGDVAVRKGSLQPSVPLVGALEADRSDAYGAAVPGVETKILWLVEEGTIVAPGDRLVQFDAAPFEKERDTAVARARELAEEARQARLGLEAARLKAASDLQQAQATATESQRELEALVNSGAPLSVKESEHDVEQKERALQEAQTRLDGLTPFVSKGYVSQEEFRAAQSKRDQTAADLALAAARHDALVHETNPDLIRKKLQESETGKAQLSIGRDRSKVVLAQAEAAERLAAVRLEEANRLVAEAEKKIAACVVTAKAPGLAVHSELFDKTGERRKIRVGDAVWGGTTVVTLPDLSRLHIEGRVPESEIHLLAPGQKASVRLDAFPDKALTGTLRRIGSLGASERNESRSFPVTIALDQTDPRFRPGMIARATVTGEKIENALLLPIQAVRTDEQGPYAVVVSALGSTSVRRIKLGRSTASVVQVLSGLDAGDIVRVTGE
jgi:HlyD family secretion protein